MLIPTILPTVICRQFHRYAEHLRNQLDVKTSIVEAFATFLLLSYVKLLSASFDLLVPTHVYHINGSLVARGGVKIRDTEKRQEV